MILENVDDKNPMDEYGITPLDEADHGKHTKVCKFIAEKIELNTSIFDSHWNHRHWHDLKEEVQLNLTNFFEQVKEKSSGNSLHHNLYNTF